MSSLKGLRGAAALLALALGSQRSLGLNVTSPATAADVASMIAGPFVTIVSAQLICAAPEQAGLFSDFDADGDDDSQDGDDPSQPPPTPPLSGAILGSAFVSEAQGPNDNNYAAGADELNGPGYGPLTNLLPTLGVTRDACVLRVSFQCPAGFDRVAIKYIFGSDNYPSTGTNPNEDLTGAFLNGVQPRHNIVRAPNSNNNYVSVNTQYQGTSFVDNTSGAIDTEMNGFTVLREAVGRILPGASNVIEIGVADGGLPAPPPTAAPIDNSEDGEDGDSRRGLRRRQGSADRNGRDLQISGQAAGAYVLLTQKCFECVRATDASRARGVTAVSTCAQIAGAGSRCRCAWSCMSSAIKKRCMYTGSRAAYSSYVSQVRTRIDSKYCRR